SIRIIGINHLDHGAWQRRIIDDRVVVSRVAWFMYGQTHQSVAISRREISALEKFLDRKPVKLRGHLGAATENPGDTDLLQRHFFAQGLQQLWRSKQATNVFVRPEESQALFNYVLFVLFGHLRLAHFD